MERQDGSADLFANFAGVMILVVVVLMMSVNVKEALVDIQNNSGPSQSKQSSIDPRKLALLEVPYQKDGATRVTVQKESKGEKQGQPLRKSGRRSGAWRRGIRHDGSRAVEGHPSEP